MTIRREVKLDASESVWFQRQLEAVDARVFEKKYAQFKARSLVPTVPGIPEWARVYTWREVERFGEAKVIAPGAKDLPSVDAKGAEHTKIIKWLGDSYSYNVMELKAAMAQGMSIDAEKAIAARFAMETLIDTILATGLSTHNLEGLLNLTGAASYTLSTKAAGGLTWGTLAAPNATAQEVMADIMGIASARAAATYEQFNRFVILLPIEQYQYASQLPLGDNASLTPLAFAKANSPYIEDVIPWHKCDGAGAGATDRMVCYARDEMVLGGIVPQEFTPMAPQLEGLNYTVNCTAACGGVVLRYASAISYADGL